MEEKTPNSSDVSLTDYVDMFRRRKGVIVQTFLLVFLIGTIVTFLSKPVYRATARILVEGKALTIGTVGGGDFLNQLQPPVSHDIGTQIEILQGAKVLKKAYETANVPPGQVKLEVKELASTDVIDITADSNNAKYAERFAATLPETFRVFLTGNTKSELQTALDFARGRLHEENAKLTTAQTNLEKSRRESQIYSVKEERNSRITEKNAADTALQLVETQQAVARTKLADLRKVYASTPAIARSQVLTSNPQV